MIIYNKKYEMIVKSIKYFFDINRSEMNMNNLKKLLANQKKFMSINRIILIKVYLLQFSKKKEAINFLRRNTNLNGNDLKYIY